MPRRASRLLAVFLILSICVAGGTACAAKGKPPPAAWKTFGPIKIEWITRPEVGVNSYVIWVREGGACWIIDPGLPPYPERILAYVQRHKLSPSAILLTHGYADHIYGLAEVLAAYPQLPVYIAAVEKDYITDPDKNGSTARQRPFHIEGQASSDLPPGGEMVLDGITWKILDTSGYSPGGRSFYCAEAKVVIVGDALSRSDAGSSFLDQDDLEDMLQNLTLLADSQEDVLLQNIREHLLSLPPDTTVLCGHGRPTSIGKEKKDNPFLQAPPPEEPKDAEAEARADHPKESDKNSDKKKGKDTSTKKKGKKKPKRG